MKEGEATEAIGRIYFHLTFLIRSQLVCPLSPLLELQLHLLLYSRRQPPRQELFAVGARKFGIGKEDGGDHQIVHQAVPRLQRRDAEERWLQPHEVHAVQNRMVSSVPLGWQQGRLRLIRVQVLVVRVCNRSGRSVSLPLCQLERFWMPWWTVQCRSATSHHRIQSWVCFVVALRACSSNCTVCYLVRSAAYTNVKRRHFFFMQSTVLFLPLSVFIFLVAGSRFCHFGSPFTRAVSASAA